MPALRTKAEVQEYIESSVSKVPGGCWEWQKSLDSKGYGILHWNRPKMIRLRLAHRVSYVVFKGEPGSLCVLHQCDNPACVNPEHLFLGTKIENNKDRHIKGRSVAHKLTEAKALEVRRLVAGGMVQKDVAAQFGISQSMVSMIVTGKWWK